MIDVCEDLLTLEQYRNLAPRAQGYACYFQAARQGSPIPDENPYPKGTKQHAEFEAGAAQASIHALDIED